MIIANQLPPVTGSHAVISPCKLYRYVLTRPTRNAQPGIGRALFCMLNPSIADAEIDDPTIRRCCGFANSWGAGGLTVVNAFGLRARDPRVLAKHQDPVGPENDSWLKIAAETCGSIVAAWGAGADPVRVHQVCQIFRNAGAHLWCLGFTKDGHPRHPLYVRADQKLLPWVRA